MNLLEMLGLNKNDVLDFFKVLERQAQALEGLQGQAARQATAMESVARKMAQVVVMLDALRVR